MLCEFGLKMPIHAPFWVFWGKMWKKRKLVAVLSLYECNNLGLMSYESNHVKVASAVQSLQGARTKIVVI